MDVFRLDRLSRGDSDVVQLLETAMKEMWSSKVSVVHKTL